MTQLKTLKDIIWEFKLGRNKTEHSLCKKYVYSVLKQEAIKWIKELQDYYGEYASDYPENLQDFVTYTGQDGDIPTTDSVISWIKYFFNITEDDLK